MAKPDTPGLLAQFPDLFPAKNIKEAETSIGADNVTVEDMQCFAVSNEDNIHQAYNDARRALEASKFCAQHPIWRALDSTDHLNQMPKLVYLGADKILLIVVIL